MPRYAIVEAPSALGHVPEHRGVERAPGALLGAELADGLAARRAGRAEAAGYSAERDPATKVYESAGDQRLLHVAGRCGGSGARRWRVPRSSWEATARSCSARCWRSRARAVRVAVYRRRRRLLPAAGQSAQRRGVGERPSVRDRPRSRRRGRHRGPAAADPRRRRGGVRLPGRCRPGTSGLPAAAGRLARCGPRPGSAGSAQARRPARR